MYKSCIKKLLVEINHLLKLSKVSIKKRKDSNLNDHFIRIGQDFDISFHQIKEAYERN